MSLLTQARYQAITGESGSQDAIDEVEADLVDVLGRPLIAEERDEVMHPDRRGVLWPRATPIISVDGAWTVDGLSLRGGSSPVFEPDAPIEVTYTGGWTVETAPGYLLRDIAWNAYNLTNPTGRIQIPTAVGDVRSLRVGDVGVTFGPNGAPRTRTDTDIVWSRRTLRHRYQLPTGV